MANHWAALRTGPNRWARANPRQWGVVCAVGWFFAGWAVSGRLWVGVIAAAVGYLVTSWSISRGPGRRFLDWRIRDRP